MKFDILKSQLEFALDFVGQSIPNKTTTPILRTVLVVANEHGVRFRSNNRISESTIIMNGITPKVHGSVCIDSVLLDVIKLYDDGEIKIDFSNEQLTVSQKKRKHTFNWMPSTDFPDKLESPDYQEYDPPALFSAFSRLKSTLGTGVTKPFDRSFHLNPHENFMTSGDGVSVSLFEGVELPSTMMAQPFGDMLADSISKFSVGEKDKFFISLGAINAFKVEGETYSKEFIFAGFQGEYQMKGVKAIKTLRDTEPALIIKVDKDELTRILRVCKVFSDRAHNDGKVHSATISSADGIIKILMDIKGLAKVDESLECDYQANTALSLRFHPGTLLGNVEKCLSPKIELRFYGDKSPFLMFDPGVENYTYLQVAMAFGKEDNNNGTPKE